MKRFRLAILSGVKALLATLPLTPLSGQVSVADQEGVQRSVRLMNDLGRTLRDAEAARLRGDCGAVERHSSKFYGMHMRILPADTAAGYQRRMQEIQARPCPPIKVELPPPVISGGADDCPPTPSPDGISTECPDQLLKGHEPILDEIGDDPPAPPPVGTLPPAEPTPEGYLSGEVGADLAPGASGPPASGGNVDSGPTSEPRRAPPPVPPRQPEEVHVPPAPVAEPARPPRTAPPRPPRTPEEVHVPPRPVAAPPSGDILDRLAPQRTALDAAISACDSAAFKAAKNRLLEAIGQLLTRFPENIHILAERRRIEETQFPRPCPPEGSPRQPGTSLAPAPSQTGFLRPTDPRMAIILDEHNKARAEVGVPRLQWDMQLAAGAATYAAELARTGRRVHASREGRGVVRENLNQGMLGWSADQMMGNWLKEKQNFVPGSYPDVATTGRWQDVSHYTQMIWPTTTAVGCGLASGSGYQWLVCRYAPGGNKDGQPVGLPSNQSVIANDSGIAPPTSATPMLPDLVRTKDGGGMTRIDPPPPLPPPLPAASDPAPAGDEAQHPLRVYFVEALFRFDDAWLKCDRAAMDRALAEMRYAIEELKKRRKAAKAAGGFSTVDPAEVEKSIELLERTMRRQLERPPRNTCPNPPAPPSRL